MTQARGLGVFVFKEQVFTAERLCELQAKISG
jgi:hypothetical protein